MAAISSFVASLREGIVAAHPFHSAVEALEAYVRSVSRNGKAGKRIPLWYRVGMTRQIAVRLPEEIVGFIDGQVAEGKASSRASVVKRALERERRRLMAVRDVLILLEAGDYPDMDDLADHVAHSPLGLD